MALVTVGVAKTIAYTSGSTVTINLKSASVSDDLSLVAYKNDNAQVPTYYRGTKNFTIVVSTNDMAKWSAVDVGDQHTNVVLTLGSAICGQDTEEGDDLTVTLSKAIVSAKSLEEVNNEDSTPVTGSITWSLARHCGDSTDPTVTYATV